MNIKTFESYLEEVAPSEVHTNNSPEGFERWLEQLGNDELMQFAEYYGKEMYTEGLKKGIVQGSEIAISVIKNK